MTAPPETIVPVQAPLEHQEADVYHPARFKVLRKGRRWGKDRLGYHCAWFGHGPTVGETRVWQGILDGWDVAWLAPDFKQGRGIWGEEVVPRFGNDQVPGVALNQQDKTVILERCGGLYFYSAENLKSIRGLGKRLKGIIINEAAWLDLGSAWRDVIRPILMDNIGWAIIMSTTNGGTDGGEDEQGNRRIPSYFNTLCEEIQQGKRSDEWMESHGTAEQNPKIGRKEFQSVVDEYPPGSVSLQQEIYAKLVTSGAGVAFPEWREDVHVVDDFTVPAHWEWGAGFDWGYWQPSVLTIAAHGEESQTIVTQERQWLQVDGFGIGQGIADTCFGLPNKKRLIIASDSSIWGVPAAKGYPNMAEEISTGIAVRWHEIHGDPDKMPVLMAVPKGHDSRLVRANLLHKYLKWAKADDGTLTRKPRIRFKRACTLCITTIPKLPPDPAKPEDVDTTANDHAYDSITYHLLSRPLPVETPKSAVEPDMHPGYDYERGEVRPRYAADEPAGARGGFYPGGGRALQKGGF